MSTGLTLIAPRGARRRMTPAGDVNEFRW